MKNLPNPPISLPAQTAQLAAVLLLFGLPVAPLGLAQTQTPVRPPAQVSTPAAKLYKIAGTVTNAVTGEPVPRASVSLLEDASRDTLQTTETGPDGEFQLEPVPAGKYPLRVARRGYHTSFFDEHDEYSSAIVTGEGQDTEHIPFRLSPGAMVHGVVTDDAGEPVEQARVLLSMKSRAGGMGEHLETIISGLTDDQGGFEFWNLIPGSYLLAVQATPWFALHPFLSGSGPAASQGQNNQAAALDVAYPVTYFDGATEETAATPFTLRSGDRAELNVALHAVPAIHLMVRSASTEDTARDSGPFAQLGQSILGQEAMTSVGGTRPGPPGSGLVEYSGIAPGHYAVTQGDPPRTVELDATGGGSLEVDPSQGIPSVSVTVKLHMAGNTPLPAPLELVLRQESVPHRVLRASVTSDAPGRASASFSAVGPGSWTLLAQSGDLALAVVSIQTVKGTLQDSRIQVGDHPLSLSVVLAKGDARVEGLALKAGVGKDGKGLPGVMVVLVPRNPAANLALFRRDQSDSDGSFSLRDVVPGQYNVVAIEDGWDLDWARPEVIGRYLPQGIAVTVTESSEKLVRLPKGVPVQAR